MGTLGNQPVRSRHHVTFESDLNYYVDLAEKMGIPLSEVIALKAVLEQERTNNISVTTGDYHDEHLGGFGDLLRELIDVLRTLAEGRVE